MKFIYTYEINLYTRGKPRALPPSHNKGGALTIKKPSTTKAYVVFSNYLSKKCNAVNMLLCTNNSKDYLLFFDRS